DERRRQAERLQREEAYYHFINDLSEEEYRLMRDGNLLGTPGEVTAEELQQRLDGAKERMSSQPRNEHVSHSRLTPRSNRGAAKRSRARVAENTVTFETESGGFRRTISRSERAGIRTYVSTIRIPLRRISETGLGEPNSTALRSILRQIMTGFGELSSLMETEADSETVAPSPTSASGANANSSPVGRLGTTESATGPFDTGAVDHERMGLVVGEDHSGQARLGGAIVSTAGGRATSRDTNNLVENGTLPILRLAHFFLLNDDEDDEHPRGLTKEQIDNLATRTYGQASLEGEMGRACSVCINEYAQGNKLRRLPCSHEFHIHCIDRWLSENNTCPICRQPILT
ncbi:unnamed protein product, partial [Tetraodon nigroviridis]